MTGRIASICCGPMARVHLWTILFARAVLRPMNRRGLGRAIHILGRLFGRGHSIDVRLEGGGVLRLELDDAYWVTPFLKGLRYEPEVATALQRFIDSDTAFIDCGANIGYWSVRASMWGARRDRIIAIEPSPHLFERLKTNGQLNGNAFRTLQAAIWSVPQATIHLATDRLRHSWGSVAPKIAASLKEHGFESLEVPTTTLDEVARDIDAKRFVVKLDVEGAELEAFEGAEQLSQRDSLFIYEEHRRDPSLATSQSLLSGGFRLYAVVGAGVRELGAVEDVMKVPRSGEAWNLIACRVGSGFSNEIDRWAEGSSI